MLNNEIKKRRLECSMSQVQLAEELGITQAHVASIELGTRVPSMRLLCSICKVLDTTPTDLLVNELEMY